MNFGAELKRDTCPEKYCSKGSILKDSLSSLVGILFVSFLSGSLLNGSGLDIAVTIIIEVVVCLGFYGLIYLLFKGMKKRLAETCISVCEEGVLGICPLNGYKNRNFALTYGEITKLVVKGERLFLYSKKGTVALTLNDAAGVAALIKSKNVNL